MCAKSQPLVNRYAAMDFCDPAALWSRYEMDYVQSRVTNRTRQNPWKITISLQVSLTLRA